MNFGCEDKNECLYVFKGIACYMIVALHCKFGGTLGMIVDVACRCGVPIFFMISGYFLYSGDREIIKERIRKRIPKLIKILLYTWIVYILYDIVVTLIGFNQFKEADFNLLNTLLFNDDGFIPNAGPLWFIPALIYVYVIIFWICSMSRRNNLLDKFTANWEGYWLPLIIIAIHMIGKLTVVYVGNSLGEDLSYFGWFSNWLLVGLPCVLLGMQFRIHSRDVITLGHKIKVGILSLFFWGWVLAVVEHIFVTNLIDKSVAFYMGILVMILTAFVFAVAFPNFKIPVLEWIGEKISLYVYLFHKIVISFLSLFVDGNMTNHYWLSMLKPITAMFLSTCIAVIIYTIKKTRAVNR